VAVINQIVNPEGDFMVQTMKSPQVRIQTSASSSFSDVASVFLNSLVNVPKTVFETLTPASLRAKNSLLMQDPIYSPLQKAVLGSNTIEELTMGQIKAMYEDYKRIITLLSATK
jgi:hypothetical protein